MFVNILFGYNLLKLVLLGVKYELKLDYTLLDIAERKKLVEDIVRSEKHLSHHQLTYMADYLLFVADNKQTVIEKTQSYPIITKNREITVNKRQVSFEDTVSNLQNGEDGLYAMIINDKDVIMDNKSPISEEDKKNIPGICENLAVIEKLKKQFSVAKGKKKYSLKRQIISKYQELYTLKSTYTGVPPKGKINSTLQIMAHMPIEENITLNEKTNMPESDGALSLLREEHIAFLLKYYQQLKQESYGDFQSDMYYMLLDLENLVTKALLPQNEVLYDLLVWEIDGYSGAEIVEKMINKYGICHSEQYFSTLWCKKIPKLLANRAQRDWLIWYFTYAAPEKASWKICRTCGKTKLAHPLFFHKNTSKDGFYSKCRDCRSKKKKGGK